MKTLLITSVTIIILFLVGFNTFNKKEDIAKSSTFADDRWYTKEQLKLGENIFTNNCASCHGYKAEKTVNWKQRLSDGSYPPPPLNDKAHAWHHPMWQLLKTIDNGGASFGGKMPAFKDTLTYEEKKAAIAYFQSFWQDKFYKIWLENDGLKEKN